ncbi:MAG: hypothetical protein M3Z83_08265 [Actinomycetota bacterium]|nr:hypothetical protein [Actinomycetota bacterium]
MRFGRRPIGDGRFDIEAGLPTGSALSRAGSVGPAELPGGPCATTTHT